MFIVLMPYDWNILKAMVNLILIGLIVLVMIGYKTKLSAIILILCLAVYNILFFPFFLYPFGSNEFLVYRYLFFQIMSVIGGLLYIVAIGPGSVSIDEKKKEW